MATIPSIESIDWTRMLKDMPSALRQSVEVYRFTIDQQRRLYGRLLLFHALKEKGYHWKQLHEDIIYSSLRRPSFRSIPWDFNISHSGNVVLCALTPEGKVGVDVEKIRAVPFEDFKRVMNDSQWQEIHENPDPQRKFFEYWTIKESVIKADGRGLALGLSDIIIEEQQVTIGENTWYHQRLSLDPHYCGSIAANRPLSKLQVTYFDAQDIMTVL